MARKKTTTVTTTTVTTTSGRTSRRTPKPTDMLIHLLLDRSYSMMPVRHATIEGVNAFIEAQKSDTTGSARFSLHTFSSPGAGSFTTSQSNMLLLEQVGDVSMGEVGPIAAEHYIPHGGTPLLDAVGAIVSKIDGQLKAFRDSKKKLPNVLLAIFTDGEENSSTRYNRDWVKEMLENRQSKGWTVAYLGANQDAWEVGTALGVISSNTMSYDTAKIRDTMQVMSNATSNLRTASATGAAAYTSASSNVFAGTAGLTAETAKVLTEAAKKKKGK